MTTLVMFLHGVGSNGAMLLPLADQFTETLPGAIFRAPDAPQPFHGGAGRQWFPVAGVTEENRPARVEAARPGLDALIDRTVAETGADRVILFGFSQGAIMALDAVARGKVREMVAIAGRLAFTGTPKPQPKARALIIGMTEDQVMPAPLSTEADARLGAAGVSTDLLHLPGAHYITPEGIYAAQIFLS